MIVVALLMKAGNVLPTRPPFVGKELPRVDAIVKMTNTPNGHL